MNSKILAKIKRIENDIKTIKIQGATNVALATIEGMRLFAKQYDGTSKGLKKEIKAIGNRLSLARGNEPLARNAVRFVIRAFDLEEDASDVKDIILKTCDAYEGMISSAKVNMIKFGTEVLRKEKVILTHCHSSSANTIIRNVAALKSLNNQPFKVVATETRPLYQGRKTAEELYKAGVDVTQIVDSACASFITEDKYLPVGAVIVGCDELLKDGSFINKVGTFSIAIAAKEGADEFYVATTLLKLGLESDPKKVQVEERDAKEVWNEAPKGLKIINPAFEQVESKYVTGYITEAGVLKKKALVKRAKQIYPWMFEG